MAGLSAIKYLRINSFTSQYNNLANPSMTLNEYIAEQSLDVPLFFSRQAW